MDQAEPTQGVGLTHVGKMIRACESCNRKKNKCDRRKPMCGLCERTGAPCVYPLKRKQQTPRVRNAQRRSLGLSKRLNVHDLLSLLDPELRQQLLPPHRLLDTDASSCSPGVNRTATLSPSTTLQPEFPPISGFAAAPAPDSESDAAGYQLHPVSGDTSDVELDGCTQRLYLPWMDLSPAAQESTTPEPRNQNFQNTSSPGIEKLPLSSDDQAKLVELYFSHVQAWLPLLHRPRFYACYITPFQAQGQPLQLDTLPLEEQLLFMGIFALAARYMDTAHLIHVPPPERGDRFFIEAQRIHEMLRQSEAPPSILLLQGSILLAFYCFTSGPMALTWGLVSRCVDLSYALDLNSIDDDPDDAPESSPEEWITKEEFRRVWWLVWELDTFNSTTSRRPCMINKRRVTVHLPCSDEAWYAGTPVRSARLIPEPKEAWKSLENCANQDERAWYLVTKYLSSIAHDLAQLPAGVLSEQKQELAQSLCCLRLTLPPIFHLRTNPFAFDNANFARGNCIIATHLILAGTKLTMSTIVEERFFDHDKEVASSSASASKARLSDITWIVSNWPPDFIAMAHPFIACTMMPVYSSSNSATMTASSSLPHDLSRLVLTNYGRVWKLGSTLQSVGDLRERSDPLSENEVELARRFAAIFPRKTTKRTYKEYRPVWSPKNASASMSSAELSPSGVVQRLDVQPEVYQQGSDSKLQETSVGRQNLSPMCTDGADLDMFALDSSIPERDWPTEVDFLGAPFDAFLNDPVIL
ncbi:Fungal specific transcription factor domain-containing protein [Cladophialophora immunda]|nr:Fungal specific transcription factor domain-containing protein [Cladophialophora immunda]